METSIFQSNEVLFILVSFLVTFIVQGAKKAGLNPMRVLAVFSLVLGAAWVAVTLTLSKETIDNIIFVALQIAGVATLIYNTAKWFFPDINEIGKNS